MDDDLYFKLQLLMDFEAPPSPPEPFEPKVFQDHPTFFLQFPNPFEPNSLNHVLATPSSTDHHAPVENNAPFSSHQALNQDSNMSMPFNHMSCCDHHHHGAGSVFECRICFGMAKQPVVTPCGHLFCWPCLSLWVYKPSNECPACRCVILEHEIIPIYGGSDQQEPDHFDTPPRPRAQIVASSRFST